MAVSQLRRLRFVSKLDKWVPLSLIEENKLNRVSVAITLLLHHEKEPFFDRMDHVTFTMKVRCK